MEVGNDYLFKIGEVAKICGITRKAILVYESEGLVIPAKKDQFSGFRYYTVENIAQIRSIKRLQSVGLTLKEIAEYHNDPEKIDEYLKRLMDIRDEIDSKIRKLKVRAIKENEAEVSIIDLPAVVCFARKKICNDLAEMTQHLRETDMMASKTGYVTKTVSIFGIIDYVDDKFDWTSCIPIPDDYDGPERMIIPGGIALCRYYRGPYENLGKPIRHLREYAAEHRYRLKGAFRLSFLEGPPTIGDRVDDYITRITVFIEN